MVHQARLGVQLLVQAAAQSDVHFLQAAADAEQGRADSTAARTSAIVSASRRGSSKSVGRADAPKCVASTFDGEPVSSTPSTSGSRCERRPRRPSGTAPAAGPAR